jgi:hypothetical protein
MRRILFPSYHNHKVQLHPTAAPRCARDMLVPEHVEICILRPYVLESLDDHPRSSVCVVDYGNERFRWMSAHEGEAMEQCTGRKHLHVLMKQLAHERYASCSDVGIAFN